MALFIGIIAFIGAVLTLYMLHIESKLLENKKYKSICDFSDKITCTGIAKSKYSHLMGVSNAVLGILYYGLVALLALFGETGLIVLVSIPALAMTLALAYLLHFKIKKICPICNTIYIINIAIFILAFIG